MEITASSHTDRIGQTLLTTVSDAIIATDRSGIISFWNPGAERIFRCPAADALGKSLDIIIPENLRGRHWQGWKNSISTGQSQYGAGLLLSVPAQTVDGRVLSIEFTILMMKDADGAVDGVIAVIRDTTLRFEETRILRRQLAEHRAARSK